MGGEGVHGHCRAAGGGEDIQIAYRFLPPAQASRSRDLTDSGEFTKCFYDGIGVDLRLSHVGSRARELNVCESFENGLRGLFPEALEFGNLAGFDRLLQIDQRRHLQLLMDGCDFLRTEPWNAEHFHHAVRDDQADFFELRQRLRFTDYDDFVGEIFADAGDRDQLAAIRGNDCGERFGPFGERLGGETVGSDTKGIGS